ncbi:hypothetical protein JXB37_07075, partial [candidate division WOR-3 bacterium]|nr:hypothetical protein [candidate division WOR-3 bacterium]
MRRSLAVLLALSLVAIGGTFTRTARFGPDDLVFSSDKSYDMVAVRGFPSVGHPGEPLLPVVVEPVVVPAGAVVTGVELIESEWQDLNGTWSIGPAQKDVILPRPGVKDEVELVGPDPAVYASAELYPVSVIRLLESGTMSGYRIAHVELRPVRWTPSTGRLQVATKLRYRLSYGQSGPGNTVATARQQEQFG